MATTNFTLKLTKVGEVQHVSDRFYKIEVVGQELRSDGKDNLLKIQAVNNVADLFEKMKEGTILYVVCEIEGREWVKGDKEYHFQNLTVSSFKDITPKREEPAYTGNPKKADVSEMFPGENQGLPFTPEMGEDDLPF